MPNAGRYGAGFVAIVTVSLFTTGLIATGMLDAFMWANHSDTLEGEGWAILAYLSRALFIPLMLLVVIRIGYRAIRILRQSLMPLPVTANSAIAYYGIVVAYVSLSMSVPIFWVVVPALLEPIIYPIVALTLLVATIRAILVNGNLPGCSVVSPQVAAILVAVAWAVVLGASMAYAQFILENGSTECFGGECPPERTLSVVSLMVAATTVTAAVVVWGLRSSLGMTRRGIIAAVAFACLALLFPVTIMPAFVMPYSAFVPSFFFGIAAVAFLIVAVARKDEDQRMPPVPQSAS